MATLTRSTGTAVLSGAAEKVTLPASYGWVWVKNMSEGDIFAGLSADISEGADGVLTIPSGECGRIQTDGFNSVYLLGTGNALVVAQNYADCPFKVGGKGGEIPDLSAYAKKTDVPNIKVNSAVNADTVNGHSVNADVPENAKFTDTIPDLSQYAEKTDIPTKLPADGGNADTLDGMHADSFAKADNPSIEGSINLLRSGNATTAGSIFAWEETVRIRNVDPNAENTTYTDLIVTPLGLFTERMLNGSIALGREKLLTESDIQTTIAGNTIFVKPNTKFPTINSAIAKAVSEQKSYIIYISDGTYTEDLDLRDIGSISLEFVGVGNVSISSNTAYPQGALYCMSNCIFRNISFFANNSYAVHIEFNNAVNSNGDYATYKNVKFENCIFGSDGAQCVGIGLGQGCTVSFINCVMQRDFYAHNQAKSNVSGQGIRLNGCQIYGKIQIDDAANSNGFSNSVVNVAITNTSAMGFVFVKDRSGSEWVQYDHIPTDDANVILDVVSGCNCKKLEALNN